MIFKLTKSSVDYITTRKKIELYFLNYTQDTSNKIEKTNTMLYDNVIKNLDDFNNSYKTNEMLLQTEIGLSEQRNKLILGQDKLIRDQENLLKVRLDHINKLTDNTQESHAVLFEYATIVDMLFTKLQENGMAKSDIQNMFIPKSFPQIYARRTTIQKSNIRSIVRKRDLSHNRDISLQNTGQPKRQRTQK